jgi:multiple antibiotic resistance protein
MDNLTFLIQSIVAFFVIIDAIGNVPLFISLLEGFKEEDRRQIIKRAIMIAMLTLIVVSFTGNWIFYLLSIKMYSFKVAGGILLLIISIEMLFGKKSKTETSEDIEEKKHDITVTPLAIPLLTGPGALTTGIVLFDNAGGELKKIAALLASILLSFLLSYYILIKAPKVFRYLGKTGTKVVVRLMGLLLLSIAVQFILNGMSDAIIDFAKSEEVRALIESGIN